MKSGHGATKPFAPFEWMLAGRYLRTRRREGFVSVIAGFSFAGIMLGVATLIIVMSVMNGFRQELFSRILGLNGHMNVYSLNGPLYDYDYLASKIRPLSEIQDVTPIIESQGLVSKSGLATGIMVRGITLKDFEHRPLLKNSIKAGRLEDFTDNRIMIGTVLAEKLKLKIGDSVT